MIDDATLAAARRAANQRNAQKSTGPKTAEGKMRARINAVKHGLTGAGLALSTEDQAEVELRFAAIQTELAPQTVLGGFLAHQMALLTVRSQRAARYETAAIDRRVRQAGLDFDAARAARARRLVARLADDPVGVRRQVLAMPEAIDRVVHAFAHLRANLAASPGPIPADRPAQLRLTAAWLDGAAADDPSARLARALLDEPTPAFQPTTAELLAWVDAEVAALRAHRATLDLDAIAVLRIEAEDLALFDPGKEAHLARKYEAATTRDLHQTLRDLRTAEALGDSTPDVEPLDAALEPEPEPEIEPEFEPEPEHDEADTPAGWDDEVVPAATSPDPVAPAANPGASANGSARKPPRDRALRKTLGSFSPVGARASAIDPQAEFDDDDDPDVEYATPATSKSGGIRSGSKST